MTGDQPLSHPSHNANGISVVVLTVALDSRITDLVEAAVNLKGWDTDYSHHRDYVSSTRRPASGSGLRPVSQYIALVNFDLSITQASETARYLAQTFAGSITIVAVVAKLDPDLMLTAMRAGCSEFLSDPASYALPELLDRLEARWLNTGASPVAPQGSILTLFGSKGGVGTTTLAVHLAMFLVQRHSKRTLLIDLHPELGHACVYLGMDGSQCLFREVVQNLNRLDSELLRGFVGQHPGGLDVLSSPDVSGAAGMPEDSEAVARTLAFLRSEYEYVVIDAPPAHDETGIAVLEASSQFYVVTSPEIGAVRDLSRHIDRLAPVDALTEKLRIVLNRSGTPHAIHADQIEKAVKLPVEIRLPDCYVELVRSQNLGEPISPHAKSDMAHALTRWVDAIVGKSSRMKPPPRKNGLVSLMKQGLPPRMVVTRAH